MDSSKESPFNISIKNKLLDEVNIDMGDMFPTLKTKDWVYRDIGLMLEPYWDFLLATIGESNYKIIVYSLRKFKNDSRAYKRGQLMISLQGIENIKNCDFSKIPPAPVNEYKEI